MDADVTAFKPDCQMIESLISWIFRKEKVFNFENLSSLWFRKLYLSTLFPPTTRINVFEQVNAQ